MYVYICIYIYTHTHIYEVKISFEDNYNFVFTFLVIDLILFYWKTRPEDVRKHTRIQSCTFMILTFLKAAFTVMNGRKSRSFDRASLYVCLYSGSLLPYFLYFNSAFLQVFLKVKFFSYGYVRYSCVCSRYSETLSQVLKQTFVGNLWKKKKWFRQQEAVADTEGSSTYSRLIHSELQSVLAVCLFLFWRAAGKGSHFIP